MVSTYWDYGLSRSPAPRTPPDGIWIGDGTATPVSDYAVYVSSRDCRHSASHRRCVDPRGGSARPVPDNIAMPRLSGNSGLAVDCHDATEVGDGAHINSGLGVLHQTPRKDATEGRGMGQRRPPENSRADQALLSREKS